jgi:fucose permease
MITFLLAVIFAAFVSLGLPDSLFGAAWPSISAATETSNVTAGIYSFVASSATIVSSVFASKLIKKLGTGGVTILSILLTAAALVSLPLAVDFHRPFIIICIAGFELGLGGGAIDAALNSYVALHFSERVMNAMHCVFGLGTASSPIIYAEILNVKGNWEEGYLAVAGIQIIIAALLIFALPLWDKVPKNAYAAELEAASEAGVDTSGYRDLIKIKGMKEAGIAFHCYSGYEAVVGLWAATYIYKIRGTGLEAAAGYASLYYFGLTAGRLTASILTKRISAGVISICGVFASLFGVFLLFLPLPDIASGAALFLIGLGSGPFYPGLMFRVPKIAGAQNAVSATSLAMVFAYTGYTLFPAITGLLPIGFFPVITLLLMSGAAYFRHRAFKLSAG